MPSQLRFLEERLLEKEKELRGAAPREGWPCSAGLSPEQQRSLEVTVAGDLLHLGRGGRML